MRLFWCAHPATLSAVLFLFAASLVLAVDEASIVRINTDQSNGKGSHGSGCFWGSGSQILTAYHVVQGATTIRVYVAGKAYDNVQVEAYAPGHDLALLRVFGLPVGISGPGLAATANLDPPFDMDLPLEVWGHPRGWRPIYRLKGNLTGPVFVSSTSILDDQGQMIFAKGIDLVPIDVTVYGGLSGAPVLANNQVVGVLSGSLHEGRSITWAIPVKYVSSNMTLVGKAPEEIDWPSLDLMDDQVWRSLNVSNKKPDERGAIHFGLSARVMEDFDISGFGAQLQVVRDNYAHKLSWGVEGSVYYYDYDRPDATLSGFNESSESVGKLLGFVNGCIVRKHFDTGLRPFYGLSLGLPVNVQVRAGVHLFARFNFELRGMYFQTTQTQVMFNNYGAAIEQEQDVEEYWISVGFNLEAFSW